MSTEHQKYSIETQSIAVQKYAQQRGFEIVRLYADEGRSGLNTDGRPALMQLLSDVTGGHADYEAVLVYDVSRWGRFQDIDESAYYEYLCRRCGVSIHYCVEPFENDGTALSAVVKNLKRVMAGEYSRDLSARTHAAQSHQVALGYRQGGTAGLGLRRMLIHHDGQQRTVLERGETKSLASDKVVLVPGPPDEIEIVRWIFEAYAERGMTGYQIADALNKRGLRTLLGYAWSARSVYVLLRNEKYIGNNVWGRVSARLKTRPIRVPREKWIRADNAFEAIVDPELFAKAQNRLARGRTKYTREQLIDDLRRLYRAQGYLTAESIDSAPDMAGCSTYLKHFGSLLNAYREVGFHERANADSRPSRVALRRIRNRIIEQLTVEAESVDACCRHGPNMGELTFNDQLNVLVRPARPTRPRNQEPRWIFRYPARSRPDLLIGARLAQDEQTILDYFFLPRSMFWNGQVYVCEHNDLKLESLRSDDLSPLINIIRQVEIGECLVPTPAR